ncbi:hypothetical protein MHU86_12133 [Fragilaria crotonensis]|nr:hypothetical protein MHU86_12133 [Fragilaria crotonensis]
MFFQLKAYALLLRESNSEWMKVDLRTLRLFYLSSQHDNASDNVGCTATKGRAQYFDYDLGATAKERHAILYDIYKTVADTWTQIRAFVETQDPLQFRGCNRSFCWCH